MLSRRLVLAAIGAPVVRGWGQGGGMFGNAEAYDRFMGRWSRMLAPLLVEISGSVTAGRALDVGSGTGALSMSAARLWADCEITGIDPSPEYVEFAQLRNPFPERVRYEVGDAQRLRFDDGMFEASLSLLVFNFIPDPRLALREVRRVTKPRGCVTAAVWDYAEGMGMLRVFWDAAVALDPAAAALDERHMPLCRAGELGELWRHGGLTEVEERPLDIVMRFESFDDFWTPFLLGQGPAGAFARRLDGDEQKALRVEILKRLDVSDENAPLSLPARAWAVRGFVPSRARGGQAAAHQPPMPSGAPQGLDRT